RAGRKKFKTCFSEPVWQISRISTPCRSRCLERKKFQLQEPLCVGTEPLCNHLSRFETLMSAQTEFVKVQSRSRSLTQGSNHLVFVCRRYINSFEPLHKTVYKWYVGGQVLWVHLEDQTELSDHNKVADKILTPKTIYKTAFKPFAPAHKLSRIKSDFSRFKMFSKGNDGP
ncbi:hypothetical protein B0H13DRAFT_2138562, partial [Mycena leptocephala]